MEDIEEDRSFEARISTILFIAALEDAKDLITAQILKRRNEQQTLTLAETDVCVLTSFVTGYKALT